MELSYINYFKMEQTTTMNETSVSPDKTEAKSSKMPGNILKFILILIIILALFFLGAKYGEDIWDKITGDDATTSSTTTEDDDEVAEDDEAIVADEESCTQTYTNVRFDELSFEYDSCYWTLNTADTSDVITEVTLT